MLQGNSIFGIYREWFAFSFVAVDQGGERHRSVVALKIEDRTGVSMQEETRDNKGTSSNLDNGLQISSHGSKPDVNHRQEGSIFLLSPSLVLSVLGGVLRAEGNVKHLGR